MRTATHRLALALVSLLVVGACGEKKDDGAPTAVAAASAKPADMAKPSSEAAAPSEMAKPPTEAAEVAKPESPAPAASPHQAFGEGLLKALIAKDEAAYSAAMIKMDAVAKVCPDGVGSVSDFLGTRPGGNIDISGALESCAGVDLSGAKLVAVRGGELEREADGCPGLQRLSDIVLVVDAGDKRVLINARDALRAGDGGELKLHRSPRCAVTTKAADEAIATAVETAKAKACACKDMQCAMAAVNEATTGLDVHAAMAINEATAGCMKRIMAQ